MQAQHVERTALIGVLAMLVSLSIWMQFGMLPRDVNRDSIPIRHVPDYFIQNFTATGRDDTSTRYILTGEYLKHFPDDHSVEIKQPCLLLLEKDTPYRYIYGDTGRIIANQNEVIFSGNVQVLERSATDKYDRDSIIATSTPNHCFPGDVTDSDTLYRTDELVVQLKRLSER